MFSCLILTKNEGDCLSLCIDSVSICDDIVVYDSYSDDNTEVIANSFGARFIRRPNQDLSRPFGGDEAFHRNWGLKHISFKYPWVLMLDADEQVSDELLNEILLRVKDPCVQFSAYRVRRNDYLEERHLKHVQVSPFYIRLVRPRLIEYSRIINPRIKVNGLVGNLQHPLNHYPFRKGMAHWFDRHNFYSSYEALQIISENAHAHVSTPRLIFLCIVANNFEERRSSQKALFYRLPFRPLLKFFLLYIAKNGFLDGYPGFIYSVNQAFYEWMISLKLRESRVK